MNTPPQRTGTRFAAGLSTNTSLSQAVEEVLDQAFTPLDGTPDLAFVFVAHHDPEQLDRLPGRLCDALGTDQLVGCTGEAVAGLGREVEHEPALAIWLARLPATDVTCMHLQFERSPDGGAIVGWADDVEGDWPSDASLLLVGEPFSFPADVLLERLNKDRPGTPVVGGMASGGAAPGENRLFFGRRVLEEGAVAVRLSGGVRLTTLVSQGCRPIGQPLVVTRAERNVIYELGGKSALEQLQAIFEELPNRERQLVQHGLHVGRVVSEYQDRFEQGDFLIRNVMGIQPDEGAVAIGDFVRAGQTVQFHLRDSQTADQELRELLSRVRDGADPRPEAALLFTCNGRGSRLFDVPDHDVGCIREYLGQMPLAGFFAQGELGPVAGQNFLHGFTASIAFFSDPAHKEIDRDE